MRLIRCLSTLLFVTAVFGGKKKNNNNRENADSDSTLGNAEFDYMVKYGWYPEGVQHDSASGRSALAAMQLFAGLEPTGTLDRDTRELIETPRCGNPDVFGANEMNRPVIRARRYASTQYRWTKNDLKYFFDNYSVHLTEGEVRNAIERAFDLWAEQSPLTFTETRSRSDADLLISFNIGDHGDGAYNAFDGPRGTLAHAFYPEDGNAHFDDEEDFTVGTHNGINLYIVAAHEFGHALGLGHSDVTGALMFPWYQGFVENYQLPEDDIQGIQQMYGIPPVDEMPGVADPGGREGENLPDTCTSPWDAVDRASDGKIFAYKGKHIWRIRNNGAAAGFPKKITAFYKKAPSNINAVVTSHINRKTYMFKGSRYWRYTGYQLDDGFPKKVKSTGLPKSVASAFVWGGNGKIHIFKGKYFYIFDERTERVKGAKRTISDKWTGIPHSVTSAMQWKNGKTYFFRGDRYWRFDDAALAKEDGYPKSKALYWMGCNAPPDLPEPFMVMPTGDEDEPADG